MASVIDVQELGYLTILMMSRALGQNIQGGFGNFEGGIGHLGRIWTVSISFPITCPDPPIA